MNQQGVRWTADQVLALAPDVASRKAGSKLGTAGSWSGAGSSSEGAVWGLCEGSGSKPYQAVVDTTGPAYTCSCPSRKFPCKHVLGLLLLWAGGDPVVAEGAEGQGEPEWAEQWLARRRERSGTEHGATRKAEKPSDPEAARRRAERRAERITTGATELEQRLSDLMRGGIASAEQDGYGRWEETAARMVDAQAPGLASRVRELGAVAASGHGWPVRLLEECSMLHLLNRGWLGLDALPEELAATVRSRVGAPTGGPARSGEGGAAPKRAAPERDRWLVLAQYDTADSRLTTRRIWLYGTGSARTVLLLSYGAAGRAPELSLPVGLSLDAELSPRPEAGGPRADLGERFASPEPLSARPTGVGVPTALTKYGEALRDDPWLDSWPVTLSSVIPARGEGDSWQLADQDGRQALPLTPSAGRRGLWKLAALSGGRPTTVFGECGHRGFTPLSAWPVRGRSEVVPLC
ncbi:SWIM zinc finger family protein [Streptomyces tsukubensis]|uniref:SWIM-type domain-containing protein n=1 Tax=Streptomyces tsukubensis TaxID=83656 RepID=A0A1V4A2C3_9ACTN|nr:SWIM zinc finger family protein [Streptomyces tsukubensis]OON74158.1 hypothetical protein B1H18_25470 [Streptomyces tsukubensis]QFR95325.1 SWIM zinc finger family protein [Streptomyces tsukubensis]